MKRRFRSTTLCLLLVVGFSLSLSAQQDFSKVQVKALEVRGGIYMLTGSGGNMGLSVGKDAVFLIDDQYAPLTEKIRTAVSQLSNKPIGFVLNTHWHGDHTGGNENLGEMGALIVAHDNVRKRMSTEQFMKAFNRRVPRSPEKALPVVSFNDTVTFYLNSEEIHAFHVPPAHTDGDTVILFKQANVAHLGDVFFNGRYPFIDLSSGGTFTGVIRAVEQILELIDEETRIIPGHGELATKPDLVKYRDMLVTVKNRVEPLVTRGMTVEEILAAKPLEGFAKAWGEGFINPENFLKIVSASLRAEQH